VERESFDILVNIRSYTDEELKALSEELQQQEKEISRTRRIIHGQIDIVRAEIVRRLRDKERSGGSLFDDGDIEKLSSILSRKPLPGEEGLKQGTE